MAKLPKYICMKVSIEDGLTVCLDPVEPEEVAADVRPVKEGHWIVEKGTPPKIICSECAVRIPVVAGWCMDAHMNFCPNCGAMMGGKQNG